jgi:hypothetical protein
MTCLTSALPFVPMARRDTTDPTQQTNFRLKTPTIERMERFKERHPLNPSLTRIVEAAVNEWLDRNEPQLPADPPKRPRR